MKKIIFTVLIFVTLSGCSNEWSGFYYPDKNNIADESQWLIKNGFKSIEECRSWIGEVAVNNNNYDYECGLKCRNENGLNICKKTEK